MVWLDEKCRDKVLSYLPREDLRNVRLVCHDFAVQSTPRLFSNIKITFDSNTFTKASKIAELDRIGSHVKKLTFNLPHSRRTFLPPLIDPETGSEFHFTYVPKVGDTGATKYGDPYTTDLLTRQYPPLFHAATNVNAFIRAFSALSNLRHLRVQCPDYDTSSRYRRSVVDYALISLRIAVEQNDFVSLRSLSLSPIHPGGLIYLSPLIGFGASPRSVSRWTRVRNLTIHTHMLPSCATENEPNHFMLLQTYLRNFQSNLQTFNFRWIGDKGPLPIKVDCKSTLNLGKHPAFVPPKGSSDSLAPSPGHIKGPRPLHFPKLEVVDIENITAHARDITAFWRSHETIHELHWESVALLSGCWDDVHRAASPPTHTPSPAPTQGEVFADIPIMLAPTLLESKSSYPKRMTRVEVVEILLPPTTYTLPSTTFKKPKWSASPKPKTMGASQKVREGWHGCEEQFKKVFRGSVFSWI